MLANKCAHNSHFTLSDMIQSPVKRWNHITIFATYACELSRTSLQCDYRPPRCRDDPRKNRKVALTALSKATFTHLNRGLMPKMLILSWVPSQETSFAFKANLLYRPRSATTPIGLREKVCCRCIRNANTITSNSCNATFFRGMIINKFSKWPEAKRDCVPIRSLECQAG